MMPCQCRKKRSIKITESRHGDDRKGYREEKMKSTS
jgi:hypothetical protein